MKITNILKSKQFIIILTIISSQFAHAQFSVTAAATDEECPGTGTLTLSVQNANPSYPVNYKVYMLPETNIPFWNSSNSYVQGLQDGEYLVVASQEIDGTLTTAQTQAIIGSNYVPLAFHINSANAVCGNDGSMVINVTSGNPAMYEILNGPATAGPQASNIFTGLPSGTYEVRVTDNCGNGFISTQTFYDEQSVLNLAGPNFEGGTLASCSQVNVGYTVTSENAGQQIVYPLSVQITVYPPSGGNPIVYNQAITSGPQNTLQISQMINYYDASYIIDCKVTDLCGTTYTLNGVTAQTSLSAVAAIEPLLCNHPVLAITPQNYSPPYTINFTSTPAGFNPSALNAAYPGPFTGNSVIFGSEGASVPLGNYQYTITDGCGRTVSENVLVEELPAPQPVVTATNHDCINFLGTATIAVTAHPLATAVITSAPSSYPQALPSDVSSQIEGGILIADGLPIGSYTFTLTDICGNTYVNIPADVPEYSPAAPGYTVRPDCIAGMGTVRIRPNVTSVTITSAPEDFQFALPYNASFNIANGTFSMEALPAGNYGFTVSTECESGFEMDIDVTGLEITTSEVELNTDCSSFNVGINYESTAEELTTFWLQKYNEELEQWVHPETGAPYDEGDLFNNENAVQLFHGSDNYFSYIGDLRVMKMQLSYANVTTGRSTKHCLEEVEEFFFYNELDIRGIYNLTCVGELLDVLVDAVGIPPLHFEIISKNGDTSFYIDNGESNVFTGLESGLYHVRVTDPCGGYRVQQFNVSELPPLVAVTQPADLGTCDMEGTGTGTFDLTIQDDIITNNLDNDIATVSYHTSLADAENGVNAIANPENYTSGTKEIYARVQWVLNPQCYGIASFNVLATPPGELYMEPKWGYCEGSTVTVTADPGYVSYQWSTGETTQSIEVGQEGFYTVTAISSTGCEISKEVQVAPIRPVEIQHVYIDDFKGDDNSVTIITTPIEHPEFYEYSVDGLNYQASNMFTGLPAGEYTAIVRDRSNCGVGDSKDFHLLNYPKYFTPNGDGINDKWRIEFAILEPGMMVYIYDRYGKPITSINATSEGWDGTLNGNRLPSTDYWFVVKREDGREHRGHFAMMR